MGKSAADGREKAQNVLAGSFAATGSSASIELYRRFNLWIGGTFNGVVVLERSFDGGASWFEADNNDGSGSTTWAFSTSAVIDEPEPGILYRLKCTMITSGTLNYRLSQ